MKITSEKIEEFGNKVVDLCLEKGYGDTCVYFNNKRVSIDSKMVFDDSDRGFHYEGSTEIKENCHPKDYFDYYNTNHVLSMSFEGNLYDALNYGSGAPALYKLFEEYGFYWELGNAWNLSAYPNDDDMEIEGVQYDRKPEPVYISLQRENNPSDLQKIMEWWYKASAKVGDIGSCVLGAGFRFNYNGVLYHMAACSPYQGSVSWEQNIGTVRIMLELAGADNIQYEYGNLD